MLDKENTDLQIYEIIHKLKSFNSLKSMSYLIILISVLICKCQNNVNHIFNLR